MRIRKTCAAGFLLLALCARAHAEALDGLRGWLAQSRQTRPELKDQPFSGTPLSKTEAEEAATLLREDHDAGIRETCRQEWEDHSITVGGHTLNWIQRHFGTKPRDGWNLYISMHGGGNAAAGVNDQQWLNQVKLYQPKDSLYVAPRAPTNTWNLWHEPHMDVLFDRFLEDAFVLGEVNPDRVYIMGYSAGGDGVYQLAPRMADRWAAAAMMAGHPNDASPLGLRNIGFTVHVGARDDGFKRNEVAAEWKRKLDDLQRDDPQGYAHEVQLHEGRGHWMNLEDKVAVEWMAKISRNPLPDKVVWKQAPVTHERFYWLTIPAEDAKGGQLVVASRKGQAVTIEKAEGVKTLTVLLNDAMMNLDEPVKVTMNGRTLFEGPIRRSIAAIYTTLADRGDPEMVFPAAVTVQVESGR